MQFDRDLNEIEEGDTLLPDFAKIARFFGYTDNDRNILPVIVQNAETLEVLLLAYVNEEALRESLKRNIAVFWSTSRNELWIKGETSGDFLDLREIRINCEQNSLLFLVKPRNEGVCHTFYRKTGRHRNTCYYRKIKDFESLEFLPGKL